MIGPQAWASNGNSKEQIEALIETLKVTVNVDEK